MRLRTRAILAALLLTSPLAHPGYSSGSGSFFGKVHTTEGVHHWDVEILGLGQRWQGQMVGGRFSVQYQYTTMLDEPLVYQVARYVPGEALVIGAPGSLMIRGAEVSEPRFEGAGDPGTARQVQVPRDWMQDLRVTRFQPNLRFSCGTSCWVEARDQDVGVLGDPGEWGWGMTAAPSWGQLFRGAHWSGQEGHSKDSWTLIADRQGLRNAVHADITPAKIVVDAGPLVRRIQRHLPEVLGALYPKPLDLQASALLGALDHAYREATHEDLASAPEVARLRGGFQPFFATFGAQLSPALREHWQTLEKLPAQLREAEDEFRRMPRARPNASDVNLARARLAERAHLLTYSNRPRLWDLLKALSGALIADRQNRQVQRDLAGGAR
jgi:hypothetical protein